MFDPDDFSTDFDLQAAPDEEPQDAPTEGGPWISHGTVHLGHRPNH